ncbi:MAG: ATP-dependent RecD-like DNA helicase [Anaerolineae bacterium]|nr:ATP-dependent RecD-like DNA helicase [Anaerolineae bacterium]
MDTITGTVERVTYRNEENGYSVVKIMPDSPQPGAMARDGTITVVGIMPPLNVGESVEFSGDFFNDPRWGTQFRSEMVRPVPPTTLIGIINYLSSGLVRGIGPRTAERIVDHFGLETLNILERDPERIKEVPGLKLNLANDLIAAWAENQVTRKTMIFLQGYGVSSKMAVRIIDAYGNETVQKVKDNPYQLADEVFGIGFMKADVIAQKMGVEIDDPHRIEAGLTFALNRLATEGNTFVPRDMLLNRAAELLKVDHMVLLDTVLEKELHADNLKQEPFIDADQIPLQAIYLPLYYYSEVGSAKRLREMAKTPSSMASVWKKKDWPKFLKQLAKQNNVNLTEQQQGAVQAALTSKVSVLTGGPGTGKTTTLQMVINALLAEGRTFRLASPTGRAAKRLSEATGQDAMTIHRMLGFMPQGGFDYDEDDPLDGDMFIIDESSMLDLVLFYNLLKAIKPESHLMLVGDVDQLPSVGAGNVLRDVIDSGIAHVTRLVTIFRQSEDSLIVLNAHRVNHGDMPHINNKSLDFFFFREEDPEAAAELVVDIVRNRMPSRFGIDPLNDIQVIVPMYRGPIGVDALNVSLQAALNGSGRYRPEKKVMGRLFRAGDKVLQTKNNYDKEVFNGDIGRIEHIDEDDNRLEVSFDGRIVEYDTQEAEQLIHGYAITVHRSQGGEYPFVVMPLMSQHYMMLQRNLLYTAITRAKRTVVLVGTERAIAMAVQNNKVAERFSGLLRRLVG